MRLIDADALLLHLTDVWYSAFVWEATAESKTIRAIMDTIEDAPTVDIVRCKDCKWHKDCPIERKPDDFCSYGRGENDETD